MSLVNALDSQLLKWRALIWSPDDLMTVLKRYLRESNESEMVVASRIGMNRHPLNRWLTTSQSPTKGRLALAACFLSRVGYL